MSRALGQVTLGPLAVAGSDLLDTGGRVLTVVSDLEVVIRSSLTFGATVGEEVGVIEATSLVATVEVALHTFGISGEFVLPGINGGNKTEPVVQNLSGELGQTVQTLKWVSWWDFFVLGGGDGNKGY